MTTRVLIIDDEENIRRLPRLTLETAGYEVVEAANGMEAFAIVGGDDAWDIVLLDQKMPGMVGTEVLRRLKIMVPKARVIMMTAFASVELAVEAMKGGATDFVRKPMTPEIVRNAVAAAVSSVKGSGVETVAPTIDGGNGRRQLTMNGFTILRASDLKIVVPHKPNERCFVVRRPDGRAQEVIIEISEEALKAVALVTNRQSLSEAFWIEQAEEFLNDFIWNDGGVPANGRLTLRGVDRAELEKAAKREIEV